MDSTIFLTTFGIIFLAELGDKTQLTAMALATRYPWRKVFVGLACAFALLNLGAVLVGGLLFAVLPLFWIRLVSGALFLFFGVTTLRARGFDEAEEEDEERRLGGRGAVVTSFLMILLAELGDKTQLVTASLAAQHASPLTVFAGSTLALWSVSLIGIFAGRQLARFVPLSTMHKVAGLLFLAFGAAILYQAFFAH
ncbi:MAG: TMEM165/GDT1 family protein [Geobacteraceae bacterium]|nr:TMEM165/GDT1 family protein [Geobacteraceae bacterium]